MYKYINIQYEIFLTELFYSKTTSFYIKNIFFLKIWLKNFGFSTIQFGF